MAQGQVGETLAGVVSGRCPGQACFLCYFSWCLPPPSTGQTCACPLLCQSVLHGADVSLAWSPRPVSTLLVSGRHLRLALPLPGCMAALSSLSVATGNIPLNVSGLWLLFQLGKKKWYVIIFPFRELKKARCVCVHVYVCAHVCAWFISLQSLQWRNSTAL